MLEGKEFEDPNFNPKKYVGEYIKDKNIEQLIRKDNQLFTEIRNLEGEMQTLVYDNYNKFISATDTVKSVKRKIDAMEEELGKLKNSVSKIGNSYDKVNTKLEPKWKEIRKLDAIERDLDKLKFLRELPGILKTALTNYATGKYTIDVFKVPLKQYLQSAELLEQYKSTTFFSSLYSEIADYILKIKFQLRSALENAIRSRTDITGIMQLLLRLNEDPNEMQQPYIDFYQEEIGQAIKLIKNEAKVEEEIPVAIYHICSQKGVNINEHFVEIKAEFNPDNETPIKTTQEIDFAKTGVKKNTMLDTVCKIFEKAVGRVRSILASYKKLFCYDYKKKEYTLCDDPKTAKFYSFANSLLELTLPFLVEVATRKNYEAEYIKEIIMKLLNEAQEFVLVLGSAAEVIEKFDKTLEQILVGHYRQKGKGIKERIEGAVVKLGDECACLDIGSFFGMLDKKYGELMATLSGSIQEELAKTTTSVISPLAEELNYSLARKWKEEINGRFIVALIHICKRLEDGGILSLEAVLLDHVSTLNPEDKQEVAALVKEDMSNIHEKFKQEIQVLFNNYVYLYGDMLSGFLDDYLRSVDWINIPEPRSINQLMLGINKQLVLIENELGLLFDKKPFVKPKKLGPKPKKGVFQMEHEMERLLAKKVKIFANVESKRQDLLIAIMRISLKGAYEGIRTLRISKFGYQQLQIDMHFIETLLKEVYGIEDETGILGGLFKEAMHSAKVRCLDPVELDETIIETITEVKLKKLPA